MSTEWSPFCLCLILLLLLQTQLLLCYEPDLQKELTLTHQEKMAFEMFKSQVIANVSSSPPAHGMMKTDIYLLRWIRERDLDVKLAVQDMHDCLEWRRAYHMDTINKEDWSDVSDEFPYTVFIGMKHQPVIFVPLGSEWNIRANLLQGRQKRIVRFLFKIVEEMFNRLYEVNLKFPNVTQFSLIGDFDGFSLANHGCSMCLNFYIQIVYLSTRHCYPNRFMQFYTLINTPASYGAVLQYGKPFLEKPVRDALRVYGMNKRQWIPVLEKEIGPIHLQNILKHHY